MKLKSACLLGLILFFTCKIITLAQLSEFSSEEFRAIDEITTEKPPAPPTNIKTTDKKNDDGTSITISWTKSADDGNGAKNVGYNILRKSPEGDFETITKTLIKTDKTDYTDDTVERGKTYSYSVQAVTSSGATSNSEIRSVKLQLAGSTQVKSGSFFPSSSFLLLSFTLSIMREAARTFLSGVFRD